MAIIYTYPTIDTIEEGDLFLVSDVSQENATRKVTAAEFGGYIQATYGPGTNMYQADGSLTGNRIITGAGFGLAISGVNQFTVGTSGDINLNPGGEVAVGAGKSISFDQTALGSDVTAIKCRSNARTQVAFVAANPGDTPNQLWVNADTDVYLAPDSGNTIFNKNLAFYTTNGGEIADIDAATGKTLVSKEWVAATYPGTVTSVDSGGFVNGLFLTGGPITSSGTISISGTLAINNSDWVGTSLSIANGGTGASTAQDGINELTQSGGAITGDVLTRDGSGNAVWEAAVNIYATNGTILSGRTATLTDTLTWNAGSIRRAANLTTIIEVTQESDFGTAVAGVITLPANTTYQVIGSVTCSNQLDISVEGVSIIGNNRQLDKLTYTGTLDFIKITDVNFTINDVWLASTNSSSLLIKASNVAASGFNNGRTRVLEIVNCQFRNCYNVMEVDGFDLVDISNTLFFYIQAPSIGLSFRDTSKLEISSCELIRWYDETTNPTPSGWATCSMIELRNNNFASFGAVNINGCIIHPQETQNGIDIGTSSTTGFGTISSSAFINTGLTTGKVFLPEASSLPDYSQTATYNYDVFANQGILNSTSGTVMTVIGNTTVTALTASTPTSVNTGLLATQQAGVRYTVTTAGRATYNGTKQVYVSLHASISYEKQGAGADSYSFYFYKNGVLLPGSTTEVEAEAAGALSLVYGTLMAQNDYIELYIENPNTPTDDMLIKDLQLVIRE